MSKTQKLLHRVQKQKAADLIAEHVEQLRRVLPFKDVNVSAQDAGRRMVQIYWLLTGEMPMVGDLDLIDLPLHPPAIEFVSPTEREDHDAAGNIVYVHPGLGDDPDIIIQGDQHDQEEDGLETSLPQENVQCLGGGAPREERPGRLLPAAEEEADDDERR